MGTDLPIRSYKELEVWQKSKSFALALYKATEIFPRAELYGLTGQIRRAGVSIPSNIAEGFRRRTAKEKTHFLRNAYGSGAELETQLEISRDLGYLHPRDSEYLAAELDAIMRMLNKAIASLGK